MMQYVMHFPKGEKYVSILKDAEDPEAQGRLQAERDRLRALVVQQLREQAAMEEADEGMGLAAAVLKVRAALQATGFEETVHGEGRGGKRHACWVEESVQ